jgi:formiminotetrahydrofolate cyclodeaminase
VHPHRLYDYKAQTAGQIFPNPASWERVSEALIKHDHLTDAEGTPDEHTSDIDSILSGLLNTHHAALFLEFMKENKDIKPEDIFFNYTKERKRVLDLVKNKDNATLGNLMQAFVLYIQTNTPKYNKKEMQNIIDFLTDIPVDTAALMISAIVGFDRRSSEFQYFYELNEKLIKDEKYKVNFFEKIQNVSKKSVDK